jgi:hypothetical protein
MVIVLPLDAGWTIRSRLRVFVLCLAVIVTHPAPVPIIGDVAIDPPGAIGIVAATVATAGLLLVNVTISTAALAGDIVAVPDVPPPAAIEYRAIANPDISAARNLAAPRVVAPSPAISARIVNAFGPSEFPLSIEASSLK